MEIQIGRVVDDYDNDLLKLGTFTKDDSNTEFSLSDALHLVILRAQPPI